MAGHGGKKMGRPSKGPRRRHPLLLPIHMSDALRAESARQGKYLNDLVIETLAAHFDIPLEGQGELPLTA